MTVDDELWAWITDLPDGSRSLVGTILPGAGFHTPLVVTTKRLAEKLEPFARAHSKASGQPVRLVHFKAVEP